MLPLQVHIFLDFVIKCTTAYKILILQSPYTKLLEVQLISLEEPSPLVMSVLLVVIALQALNSLCHVQLVIIIQMSEWSTKVSANFALKEFTVQVHQLKLEQIF